MLNLKKKNQENIHSVMIHRAKYTVYDIRYLGITLPQFASQSMLVDSPRLHVRDELRTRIHRAYENGWI